MLYIVQVLYVSFRPTALAGEGLVELLSQPQVCHFLFSTPMSEVQDNNIYKHGTLRKVNCTIMHICTAKNMLKYIHMQRRLCIACAVTSVNLQCCAGSRTEGSPHWECSNNSGRQDIHRQGAPHIGSPSIGRLLHVWRVLLLYIAGSNCHNC